MTAAPCEFGYGSLWHGCGIGHQGAQWSQAKRVGVLGGIVDQGEDVERGEVPETTVGPEALLRARAVRKADGGGSRTGS
jgi:hypothetical protein